MVDDQDLAAGPSTLFDVRRPRESLLIIAVAGEVTAESELALMEAFDKASDDATDVVAFDFTGLDYMNSGGIGLLITLLVRANRQRQRLVAFGLDAHYRQIFELTRLDEAITLYDDEHAALAEVAPV
jgi:anti-anti-sigma factor